MATTSVPPTGVKPIESLEQMLLNLNTKTNCTLDEMNVALIAIEELAKGTLLANLEMMKAILLIKNNMNVDSKQMYITIPESGGFYTVQPGATTIDFVRGEIINPDGTVNSMRTSLRIQDLNYMRSFMMATSGDLDVSIDGAGIFSIDAGEKFSLGDFDFRELYLGNNSSDNVLIKLMASTTPEMTVFYDKYFAQELQETLGSIKEELYDADQTSQQIITLDTTEAMNRVNVEAYGTSSSTTDWTLEASNDNSHWFSIDATEGQSNYHWGGHNATRYIRLSSAAGGAPGDTVSLVLTSTR